LTVMPRFNSFSHLFPPNDLLHVLSVAFMVCYFHNIYLSPSLLQVDQETKGSLQGLSICFQPLILSTSYGCFNCTSSQCHLIGNQHTYSVLLTSFSIQPKKNENVLPRTQPLYYLNAFGISDVGSHNGGIFNAGLPSCLGH
jgi:hypothetical protein